MRLTYALTHKRNLKYPLLVVAYIAATAAHCLFSGAASAAGYYNLAGFWKGTASAPAPVARLISTAYSDNGGSAGMTYFGFSISTTGVNNGDLMILISCIDNGSTTIWPNPFAGTFNQITQDHFGNDGQTCVAAWKVAYNEPATLTGNYGPGIISGSAALTLIAITGYDPVNPIQSSLVTVQTGTDAVPVIGTSAGLTTSVPNTLIVYAEGVDWDCASGTSVFTPPNGYTSIVSIGDNGNSNFSWTSLQVASHVQATPGATGSITGSMTGCSPGGLGWIPVLAIPPPTTIGGTPTQLAIKTAPQTLSTTWQCSGAVKVELEDASGVATPSMSGDLTLNLGGSGVAYYYDSACTVPVTSSSIQYGTVSRTLYFQGSRPGSVTFGVSAAGVSAASQSETITALIAHTWTGGASCNGVWSTAACWTGGIPTSSQTATFDDNCTTSCTATLGADVNVGGLAMRNGNNETLVLNGHVLSVQASAGVLLDGQSFTMNGTLEVKAHYTYHGTTIDMTGSTLKFNDTVSAYQTWYINPGNIAYNNVYFGDTANSGVIIRDLLSNTLKVNGTLTIGATVTTHLINTGTIAAFGDIATTALGYEGTAVVQVSGTGNQLISSSGTDRRLIPNLNIAKTGGTLTFSGSPTIYGNYTFASTGGTTDFTTNNSELRFFDPDSAYNSWTLDPGTATYNKVTFVADHSAGTETRTFASGSTMLIASDLQLGIAGSLDNTFMSGGTLDVKGNVNLLGNGLQGDTIVKISGSSNQSVDATGGTNASLPSLTIASTGGTVTFNGNPTIAQSFIWQQGSVDFSTNNVTLTFNDWISNFRTYTITPGPINFNNVSFVDNNWAVTRNLSAGSTMDITGNLTLGNPSGSSGTLAQGTLVVSGNVSVTGGIKVNSNINVAGDWLYSTGGSFASDSGTVTFTPGANHAISGPNTFYGLTMDNSGVTSSNTLTFQASKTQTIKGPLSLKGNTTNRLLLRSSSAGTQATIDLAATTTLGGYLDVQDMKRTGTGTLHTGSNSIGPATCAPSQNVTSWTCP